jgi:Spy/CpxP family protein refolding chaperone
MKLKLISLLAGGVVLLTPFSKPVWAQPEFNLPIMAGVELTQPQEAQLTQIRLQTRQQIQKLLPVEQRNQFKVAMEQGKGLRQAIAAMNLSPDQQTQLRSIFQSARKQMAGVLTPQQKQRLMQNLRSRIMQSF